MLVAVIALVAALAGTAVALPGKNSVKSNDVAKNAIKGKHVKKNSLGGSDVDEASLAEVPSAGALAGHQRIGVQQVTATDGASEAAARTAAPEVALFTAGPLTIYGKCFTNTAGPETFVETYVKTSQNGALLYTDEDTLDGDPDFLDTDTLEVDRQANSTSAGANAAEIYFMHSTEIGVQAPDGTAIEGRVQVGAKNGTLAGGNGLWGDGNVCRFAGDVLEFNG